MLTSLLEGSTVIAASRERPDGVRLTLALPRWCGRPAGMRERVDLLLQGLEDPDALPHFAGATAAQAARAACGPAAVPPVELVELRTFGSPRLVLRDAGGRTLAVECRAVAIELPE